MIQGINQPSKFIDGNYNNDDDNNNNIKFKTSMIR